MHKLGTKPGKLGVACLYAVLAILLIYPFYIEPTWLRIKKLKLSSRPSFVIVHFSDLHYKGDKAYLRRVISAINAQKSNIACFTGDIVEDPAYLDEALQFLSEIKCPLYGVPGNHDEMARKRYPRISDTFSKTGGAWLVNRQVLAENGSIKVVGSPDGTYSPSPSGAKLSILLIHYPGYASSVSGSYNIVLAGHSHGGQVRLPLWGALTIPFGVGKYERGLYFIPPGPMYVTTGVGTLGKLPVRFLCRPEVVRVEL
jgi:uncharacterized protein